MKSIKRYKPGNKKLSVDEKKILLGSTNPPDTILVPSRIGDNGPLNIEANHFQETIDETNDPIKYKDLDESKNLFLEQKEIEVRY